MIDDGRSTSRYAPRTVQSVSRAVALLRALSAGDPLTLSALARRLDVTKPAAYNLLNSLQAEGMIVRDIDGRYRLAWGAYELSAAVTSAHRLKSAARWAMKRASTILPGAVLLSVRERGDVLYVDREQRDPFFHTIAHVGARSPLHTTASGKLLLAHLGDRERAEVLSRPLAASTAATVTDPRRLDAELERIRVEGYATCWGEREPKLSSIAVPVLDAEGRLAASFAVALPTETLMSGSPSRLAGRLREASQEIRLAA